MSIARNTRSGTPASATAAVNFRFLAPSANSADAAAVTAASDRVDAAPTSKTAPASRSLVIPLIVGCALFMQMLDSTVIANALPAMAQSLHEDPARLNLAITSYLLSLAVFIPVSGWVADRFGARRVFALAIAVFTASSVLCGTAHSLPFLIGARLLQGVGGAMMVPVGRLVVLKTVPKADMMRAMSALTAPAMLGSVLGAPVGGFIVTFLSWRWIFFINIPVGVLGIALVLWLIPDIREPTSPPLDWRGFLLSGVGLAALVFGFETIGRGSVSIWITLATLFAGAACWTVYFFHQRAMAYPILDLRLMRLQTFAAATLGGGLCRLGFGAIPFLMAMLLQVAFGLSPFAAGLITFASAAGALINKPAIRPIVAWVGFRTLLIGTALFNGLFLCGYALFRPNTPHIVLLGVLLVGGFFRSMLFTSLNTLGYADVPPPQMGRATSLASTAQQVSLSLGVGFAALLLHASLVLRGGTTLTTRDVWPAFLVVGVVSLASLPWFLRLDRQAGAEVSGRLVRGSPAA
jgi:EmrB/QacA subfamily drug resistance transporter